MKKTISLLLAFLMLAVNATAAPLYTKESEEIVTGGAVLKNIQRFYGDYALNINCVTADLKNENLTLELLKHKDGADKTQTVMNFAKEQEHVVTAINADFFSAYKDNQNFSLGIEIKDGKLLQSHINSDMAAGLFKDNALLLSHITLNSEITAPNGEKMVLTHINKPTDYYGALLMYTSDFNTGTSPFLPEGISVVTVQNGKVSAKGISMGGTVSVPDDGYILVINDSMTPFLEHNFNIGDEVKLSIEATPSIENIKMAFGGGTLLLQNGEKTPITHNVSGNNPRSVIGTNADGSVIYMITVDGRQSLSKGVSLDVLADICKELGCVNAINLDGGGSTAMVGKTLKNGELHFINSPSENRKVINAVAVTSSAQRGDAEGFFAQAEKDVVLSGDSVRLNITAYDKNYNTPKSITKSTKWVVSKGEGSVRDNVYYAKGSGETVLDLYYNGKKTDSCTIKVIDDIIGIVAPQQYSLSVGESVSTEGKITVFDKEGNSAEVSDIKLLNPQFDNSFISVDKNSIKALKAGGNLIKLSYKNAERSIKVICGKYDADITAPVVADDMLKEKSGGFSFNVLGAIKATTLFDRIAYARAMDIFRKADASAVLGGGVIKDITPEAVSPVSGEKWGEYNHENVKIISLALAQGGKMARTEQWKNLAAALEGANQKNIIVLFDSAPQFVTQLDKEAFSHILSDAAKDKNVFAVYNGDENFCRIANGVRYISVSDLKDEDMLHKAIENTKYLSFNITGDEVTYCFKNIYE